DRARGHDRRLDSRAARRADRLRDVRRPRGDRAGEAYDPDASPAAAVLNTSRPSKIVSVTLALWISCGGILKRSALTTTRSASFPSVIEPLSFSSNEENAPLMVYAPIARSSVTLSLGTKPCGGSPSML